MTWIVAKLSPTAPRTVYTQLVQGGHGCFLPTYQAETAFRGKARLIEVPLIPRYVFLRYTHRWPDANKIEGVKVLTYPNDLGLDEPHILTEERLARIQKTAEQQGIPKAGDGDYLIGNQDPCDRCNHILDHHAWLESLAGGYVVCPGEQLRVCGGNWTDYLGTLKKRKHGTAELDIDFMNRTVPISIPLHQLERIGDHPRGRPLPAQKPDMQSA